MRLDVGVVENSKHRAAAWTIEVRVLLFESFGKNIVSPTVAAWDPVILGLAAGHGNDQTAGDGFDFSRTPRPRSVVEGLPPTFVQKAIPPLADDTLIDAKSSGGERHARVLIELKDNLESEYFLLRARSFPHGLLHGFDFGFGQINSSRCWPRSSSHGYQISHFFKLVDPYSNFRIQTSVVVIVLPIIIMTPQMGTSNPRRTSGLSH